MPRRPKPPPPTIALFVRHGRTPTTGKVLPGRAPGLHLADEGRAQADAVAERLSVLKKVDAIYASPLERARETAAPIGRRLKLKVTPEKGLLECDFGEWTGADLKALNKLPEWRGVQQHPSGFRFPGGESFREMQGRIAATLGKLRARHPGQTVVLVSHADPIKVAVADAAGTHLDLFQRVVISPCSVTAIGYSDTGPFLLTVNSLGDLGELKVS
ncbi:MAG TPA: MSMEG_4193 family putative phosphomutase [Acidimicrobiales bacterium]|nr:MSMEG_4193 family putative phosphomutase [Acidimicrobiales bacterium]